MWKPLTPSCLKSESLYAQSKAEHSVVISKSETTLTSESPPATKQGKKVLRENNRHAFLPLHSSLGICFGHSQAYQTS